MNIEDLREFCLSFKGVTESFPFDEETLVFKVKGKMFALTSLDGVLSINLKCNPENAIELREQYSYVLPGYHMNKKHWNTVMINSFTDENLLREWIADSYNLVVSSLPVKVRTELLKE